MDEEQFYDGLCFIGEDASCICGNYLCENSWNLSRLDNLTHKPQEHALLMHTALKAMDCAKVCQLLQSGMKLCCSAENNCFSYITKYWQPPFINTVLKRYPSAANSHGPNGDTLLMMCDSVEKFQTVLGNGPDVNAVNDDGDNILHYIVKHRLSSEIDKIIAYLNQSLGEETYTLLQTKMDKMAEKIVELFEVVLDSDVNVDAVNGEGKTALQLLLQTYKPGYVFNQGHYICKCGHEYHNEDMCYLENQIASNVLTSLLVSGAAIPGPDELGRTPLMLAVQSPWNDANMEFLVRLGADINAKDRAGHNAIFYLLSSFAQHSIIRTEHPFFCWYKFSVVDRMTSFLLDHGCEMQGQELIMFDHAEMKPTYKVVVRLMSLKTSTLIHRDFNLKLQCKNDPSNLSFLSTLLESRCKEDLPDYLPVWKFELEDVAFIEKEIENGLDVNCGTYGRNFVMDDAMKWKKKLCLPYPLLYTMDTVFDYFFVKPGDNLPLEAAKIHYRTLEGILRLLLPFWPHPPLALVIFDSFDRHDPDTPTGEPPIVLRKRLLQFLYEVGGPLSPGSELYLAARKMIESGASGVPAHGQVLQHFDQLHSNVPSLRQLTRTAFRACLKQTDTRGLDMSSLRVLCEGEMQPLPQEILDFVNFKSSSVSVIQVLPSMFYREP
ncbi:hypothetical protein B566_EDAN001848 [Ephemera danica]|nr:hypothetical protein B566_EDAN001848 [Ephemera danica]